MRAGQGERSHGWGWALWVAQPAHRSHNGHSKMLKANTGAHKGIRSLQREQQYFLKERSRVLLFLWFCIFPLFSPCYLLLSCLAFPKELKVWPNFNFNVDEALRP